MVDTLDEDLRESWDYTPRWKDHMKNLLESAFGAEGTEIKQDNIDKLVGIIHGDGVKHIVEGYLSVNAAGLDEKARKNLSRMAYQFLPDEEEIKNHWKGKVVNPKAVSNWIDSLEERLDDRLFRHVAQDIPNAPRDKVIAKMREMGAEVGFGDLPYEKIITESKDALPIMQRIAGNKKNIYQTLKDYGLE